MNKTVQPQWLEWAKELQFIAQGGLTYSKDVFDIERFERIREIAAEMLSLQSEIPIEKVKNLFCNETGFQTPKLDTRAAIFKDDKILLVKEDESAYFGLEELPILAKEKNNEEQIKMCFSAYYDRNWQVLFD